jgi:hypothetical protein
MVAISFVRADAGAAANRGLLPVRCAGGMLSAIGTVHELDDQYVMGTFGSRRPRIAVLRENASLAATVG